MEKTLFRPWDGDKSMAKMKIKKEENDNTEDSHQQECSAPHTSHTIREEYYVNREKSSVPDTRRPPPVSADPNQTL